jgi:hypothetical protein
VAFKVEEAIRNFRLKRMKGQLRLYKVKECEIHLIILYMWMTSYLLVVISIYCMRRSSSRFNKKVLGEMSLVIRIEIHRDRRKEVLGLSHRYAKKSFKRNKVPMQVILHLFPWSRVIVLETFMFQEAM